MNVSGSSSKGKYALVAEMNMIPFIDIALVLLIIFMVMTPFLVESQIKVNLPRTAASDPREAQQEKPLRAHIRADGAIYLEEKPVPDELVESTLAVLATDPANQGILIEADKAASFERVVLVMGAAKKLGIGKMSVGVVEEKKPAARRR